MYFLKILIPHFYDCLFIFVFYFPPSLNPPKYSTLLPIRFLLQIFSHAMQNVRLKFFLHFPTFRQMATQDRNASSRSTARIHNFGIKLVSAAVESG